jgi:hypothetical protein
VLISDSMRRMRCPSYQQRKRNLQLRDWNILRSGFKRRQILPAMHSILRQVRERPELPDMQECICVICRQHLRVSQEQLHQSKGRMRAMQSRLRDMFQRDYLRQVPGPIGPPRQQLYSKMQSVLLPVRSQVYWLPKQLCRMHIN